MVMHLCAKLHEAKMDQVRVTVGTNLSYPEETVTSGAPGGLSDGNDDGTAYYDAGKPGGKVHHHTGYER